VKTLYCVLCLSALFVFPGQSHAASATDPKTAVIPEPKRFNYADVHRRAAQLAKEEFKGDGDPLPEFLANMGYDEYRDIRYENDKALWKGAGLPFLMKFFHRGFLFTRQVKMNVIENGEVRSMAYSNDLFSYGLLKFTDPLPADLGFAGFQVFYPLQDDNELREVAAFLGASYFRAVGQHQNYGLSARGLAIDTGLPSKEEFPFFREFWLERPDKDATGLTIHALLDSPSVAGAYRFIIKPGVNTVMDVKASLFFRKPVKKLGIAPLTSMFFHGENTERCYDDFRPEVHDSDGLLIAHNNGEWLWRPLNNPQELQINSYGDANPAGFGLMQRDRLFDHYQDLASYYHRRPSLWVEPLGDWGKGAVELVEIPTDAERNDNIVAYWVPDKKIQPGKEMQFEYRLHFALEVDEHPGGKVLSTHVGRGGTDSMNESVRKFVLDFGGKNLENLPADAEVKAKLSVSSGKILHSHVQKNEFDKTWRVFFEFQPEGDEIVNLRCFLQTGENVLSETWNYQWRPLK
jgi:glucans biosynthesis protein